MLVRRCWIMYTLRLIFKIGLKTLITNSLKVHFSIEPMQLRFRPKLKILGYHFSLDEALNEPGFSRRVVPTTFAGLSIVSSFGWVPPQVYRWLKHALSHISLSLETFNSKLLLVRPFVLFATVVKMYLLKFLKNKFFVHHNSSCCTHAYRICNCTHTCGIVSTGENSINTSLLKSIYLNVSFIRQFTS